MAVTEMDEDRVYDQLEALIRSGQLRADGFDDSVDYRGPHLAALTAPDADPRDELRVLAAITALAQLAGWDSREQDLDWDSLGDLQEFRESVGEMQLLVEWARRALDGRLAELNAERVADGMEDGESA